MISFRDLLLIKEDVIELDEIDFNRLFQNKRKKTISKIDINEFILYKLDGSELKVIKKKEQL